MLIRPDGIIANINNRLLSMAEQYGVSPDFTRQGASFFELRSQYLPPSPFDPFFDEINWTTIEDVLQGSVSEYSFEYAVRWSDAESWILCEVIPMQIGKDHPVQGILLSFTDITRFKRKELRLEQALAHSFPLPGHIPICAVCKHVRHAEDWEPVESYLESRLPIEFTHDICPDCIRRLYPKYSSILDDPHLPED